MLCLIVSLCFSPSRLSFSYSSSSRSFFQWLDLHTSPAQLSESGHIWIRSLRQTFTALPQVLYKPSSPSALFPSFLSALFLSPHFSCWTSAPTMLCPWTPCQSWDPSGHQSTASWSPIYHLPLNPCPCALFTVLFTNLSWVSPFILPTTDCLDHKLL